ncbi:choline uptake/conversion transcriptional regulator CudC [Priestia filamentosa]|uniref:choline uptake/conversion transcriptional regulator CudC n=1 Tax=Priestia filamentosa TaxID=1402861 RepID=UPI000A083149|nr:GbsR/MarR family transcriptional regulator [Priestia filamentosa]MDT3765181.1 GbsR/MarR family transcriptional regulator [Priestia filamentosa]WRU95473.1 GbsR/MarR family transcriptional regulator [Priestia filamentosa]SMF65637.1 DNA-binding transcriptional regulator GbsR, MarR family [Priestia filamentosa]
MEQGDAGKMTEKARASIEHAKGLVTESIAETMDLYGVTGSVGNLFGTMYFENDMTLDEMREKLGMSKPSMSTGVRRLQELDIVKKTFIKGSRKHTYVAEKDFFHFFANFFTHKWEREVKLNLEAIEQAQEEIKNVLIMKELEEDLQAEARDLYHQLEDSKPYYAWLHRLVESIRSGKIYEFIPKEEK